MKNFVFESAHKTCEKYFCVVLKIVLFHRVSWSVWSGNNMLIIVIQCLQAVYFYLKVLCELSWKAGEEPQLQNTNQTSYLVECNWKHEVFHCPDWELNLSINSYYKFICEKSEILCRLIKLIFSRTSVVRGTSEGAERHPFSSPQSRESGGRLRTSLSTSELTP